MELVIKAKHFVDAVYSDICNCPAARAARDLFPYSNRVEEGVDQLYVDGECYDHARYRRVDFDDDREKIKNVNDPEYIVRTISLTKNLNYNARVSEEDTAAGELHEFPGEAIQE